MKLRNLLALMSMTLLLGASACSTTESAQTDAAPEVAQQSQDLEMAPKDDQAEAAHEMKAGDKHAKMKEICPMQVEGTTRELSKLDDAVAMDFTTTGDVDELRARVEKMSQMHGKMHGEGGDMHHGKMHGEMKHGEMKHGEMTEEQREMREQMKQMMSDVTVSTEELDSGMRLKLTPADAAQVDALYGMMQKRSEAMGEHGQCPMKMMGAGAQMQEQPQN
ncbi:hypothetical protein DFR33_110105 [Bradymonas sediminis]|nr:hypothetical protein DFR33_110105 [Bradymonas sediminis]